MKNRIFTTSDQTLLEEVMFHRRDIRGNHFLKSDVSDEVINRILHSATLAPSVGFSQPWEYVVIRDHEIKEKIADNFKSENTKASALFSCNKSELYNNLKLEGILEAPVNIAVFYKPSNTPVLGQNSMLEMGEYSVVCAIQNMWLMSRVMNIGMGWVSILNPDYVKNVLNSPVNNKLVAYLCIGYVGEFPALPELEQIKWEKRKQIESVVYHNQYPAEMSGT